MVRLEELGGRRDRGEFEKGAGIVRAALARAGCQSDVWRAHEVGSFTFMHSNQQLAARVQRMQRLGQRAAESRFVVRLEECGGRRGRGEFEKEYWNRTACEVPNRCMEGTRGELIRLRAFKPAEM